MFMSLRPAIFLLVFASLTGCSLQKNQGTTTVSVNLQNPAELLRKQAARLEGGLELEVRLRNIFDQMAIQTAGDQYVYPIQGYTTMRTKKVFGQYIAPDSGDRFSGYHTGDDIEVADVNVEMPVVALASGTIVRKETVAGYGGVVIIEFSDVLQTYHALYGHLDLASMTHVVGDTVVRDEVIANLGDDASVETDGERKHLHFGIYPYTGTELFSGYVASDADLSQWVNPSDFLREHEAVEPS